MKLNYKRTLYVGLAFMAISAFWSIYDNIVPLILKETFHLNEAVSGAVMALDNVLALILLPVFGALSDRTHTRIGRRMPYIIAGTTIAACVMLLLPIANSIKSLPLFFIALGVVLLAMSSYRSPAVALMPDVTPKPLRSKGNAVINLMGALGGLFALAAVALLVPKQAHPSYMPVYVALFVVMLASLALLVWKIREPREVRAMQAESRALGIEEEQEAREAGDKDEKLSRGKRISLAFILLSVFLWFFGYNAVTTAFSRYARFYWGLEGGAFAYTLMIAQVAAIVFFLPVGQLASKWGRRKTILIGCALLALAFAAAFFFKTFTLWIFVFFAIAGVGWAAINVNSYPMVVELSRGADVGKYTGLYYTFSMSAQVITPILSGALLQYVGYWTLFPYAAVCVALSFVTMLFVKHGDAKPVPPKGKLEAFDALDS
nr:MFS transporter [Maliibacterium massiliense]